MPATMRDPTASSREIIENTTPRTPSGATHRSRPGSTPSAPAQLSVTSRPTLGERTPRPPLAATEAVAAGRNQPPDSEP